MRSPHCSNVCVGARPATAEVTPCGRKTRSEVIDGRAGGCFRFVTATGRMAATSSTSLPNRHRNRPDAGTSPRRGIAFGVGPVRRRISLAEIEGCRRVRNSWWWGIRLTPRGWLWNVSGLDAVELMCGGGKHFPSGTDEPDAALHCDQHCDPQRLNSTVSAQRSQRRGRSPRHRTADSGHTDRAGRRGSS